MSRNSKSFLFWFTFYTISMSDIVHKIYVPIWLATTTPFEFNFGAVPNNRAGHMYIVLDYYILHYHSIDDLWPFTLKEKRPQGQLNDGIPEGRGVIKWLDGSWYRGEFLKGLRHGRGLHVSCEDGRRWYSGEWANGKRNGRGETSCCVGQPDGALNYSGDWVDGRPHGSGTASWPDGTQYTGGWADGRQHGRGKTVWPNDHVSLILHYNKYRILSWIEQKLLIGIPLWNPFYNTYFP